MDALDALLCLPEDQRTALGLLFTPSEIFQQPRTWRATYRQLQQHTVAIRQFLESGGIGPDQRVRPAVRLIGAGTSDYVGRSVRALFAKQWRCDALALPSAELLTNPEDWIVPRQPSLWVWFSRSGDTAESVAGLERALAEQTNVRHIVITCNEQGQLVKQFSGDPSVLSVVLDEAVNDRGLAMTSSFSNMVIAAHALAHTFSPGYYGDVLEQLVVLGESFRGRAAEVCASLAAEGYAKVCFLGTGTLNAVAHECALKVLELTAGQIHTMSQSSLGVRHGPLSALDQETLVVSFLSSDPRRRGYEADMLTEIRAKKLARTTVAIGACDPGAMFDLADRIIPLGTGVLLEDDYRPPVDAIFGQLLGLFCSLQHGLKPDSPSPNGAISRVVSTVKLYQ